MASISLTNIIEKMKLENLTPEIDVKGIKITQPDINRPALPMAGYFEHFEATRLQIIGFVEYSYISSMSESKEREVLEEALVNTSFLYPPRLYCVEEILSWEKKKHGDGRFMAEGEASPFRKGARGYLLTNTLEINGAIALFYPGVLKKLAEGLEGDFYIAFTSIHEAQIHAAGMVTPEAVETSLRDTNRHCNRREEILTDRVYCYRRETQSLGIIDNGEFLEVKRDE